MQFFHTGAKTSKGIQTDPLLCLGGYVSSTPLPNGRLNAVFNDISMLLDEQGGSEIRGLALINTTGAAIVGKVYLWFDYPSTSSVTFALPDAEAASFFEVIGLTGAQVEMSFGDSPMSAQFELLKTRIIAGLVYAGDYFDVNLTDGTTTVTTKLYVKEVSYDGVSNCTIVFASPDFVALSLTPSLTEIQVAGGSYVFTSRNLTNRAKFEVAPVTLSNNDRMEAINDIGSLPFAGTFYEPHSVGNKILIANNLAIDAGVGLWFRRTVEIPNPLDAIEDTELEAYLATLKDKETISVTVEYP